MAVFPATYYGVPAVKYPENGNRIQLSNSYAFTAAPTSPDMRVFTVTLEGMQYFQHPTTGLAGRGQEPERNQAVLDDFYQSVHMNTAFDFFHPAFGTLSVKFNAPLQVPEAIKGANGMIGTYTVELIEQP